MKTRLAPHLGDDVAADVAQALLRDTWAIAGAVSGVKPVLSTSDPSVDHGLGDVEVWDQGDGDLGARVERMLARAVSAAGRAIAIGADGVAVHPGRYAAAFAELNTHDAVIGHADDGGFYLLGLRRVPDGLLADLPWSDPTTGARTQARLIERGLTVSVLEPSWDVDRLADLKRVRTDVPRAQAPHVHAVLDGLGWDHEGPA